MAPLHVLVFLSPLVALYELGSAMYLAGDAPGTAETIRARRVLSDVFDWFGVSGLHLPAVLVVVVLLVWHVLTGAKWRLRAGVLGLMAIEAVAWTLPLLVLGQVLYRVLGVGGAGGAAAPAAVGAAAGGVAEATWQARATIALGAGVYEEMLFRLVGIALVHFIVVDLIRAKEAVGRLAAIGFTSVAFALYHNVSGQSGGLDLPLFAYYLFAGAYFGVVYMARGFGIVVAVHALYDLAVLVLLPHAETAS